MPRWIAVEWGNREARIAIAEIRRGRFVLDQAFVVPLPARSEGQSNLDASAGEAINSALAQRGLARGDALIAIGRSSIELKQLSLPPCPVEELPELVRFQAQLEFNSLTDDWALDFLPSLADDGASQQQVLAAAMAPSAIQQVQEAAAKAGLKPQRLVLRPCAAASLLRRRRTKAASSVRLLVDVLRDEADLTVLADSREILLRTARLPGDVWTSPDELKPLVGEIRRTVVAAQNQLGGQKVERIELCGSGADYMAVAERLGAETGLPVDLFDPFAECELSDELRRAPPEHTGRFAPLVGMLLDESESIPHAIDFLHPRRKAVPKSRRRPLAIGGAIACAVVLLAGLGVWWHLSALDAEIRDLKAQVKAADQTVDKVRALEARANEIEEWAASDVSWLDELRELATEFPESKRAMLTFLRCSPLREGAEMHLEGLVTSANTVDELEAALRDLSHHVEGHQREQESKKGDYHWRFDSSLLVTPSDKEAYAKRSRKEKSKEISRSANAGSSRKGG